MPALLAQQHACILASYVKPQRRPHCRACKPSEDRENAGAPRRQSAPPSLPFPLLVERLVLIAPVATGEHGAGVELINAHAHTHLALLCHRLVVQHAISHLPTHTQSCTSCIASCFAWRWARMACKRQTDRLPAHAEWTLRAAASSHGDMDGPTAHPLAVLLEALHEQLGALLGRQLRVKARRPARLLRREALALQLVIQRVVPAAAAGVGLAAPLPGHLARRHALPGRLKLQAAQSSSVTIAPGCSLHVLHTRFSDLAELHEGKFRRRGHARRGPVSGRQYEVYGGHIMVVGQQAIRPIGRFAQASQPAQDLVAHQPIV